MFKRAVLVLVVALGVVLGSAEPAQAYTNAELMNMISTYESTARAYEQAGFASVAQQLRDVVAQLRAQLARQQGQTGGPSTNQGGGGNATASMQQQIQANAARSRQWTLGAVAGMRPGRNGGFLLYYQRPPVYAGQGYTNASRPYFASSWEVNRVINMLTNNGNYIYQIQPY